MTTRRCNTGGMFWCEVPRDVVEVAGPDAATYLQSQLSNDLRDLEVGASRWAFLLQPTGKIDVLLRVWRRSDEVFVLDTDAGFGDVMTARLNRFKIRVKAEITTLAWRCIAVRGGAHDGLVAWGDGADLLGPFVDPPADVRAGTADELLAARIAAAWPAMGAEIVPGRTIPAESGVIEQAVSFTKGCYPGQELVERMDSRGATAPRSLAVVSVPDATAPGDPYVVDGVEVGTVTSVSGRTALALVRRGST